MWYFLFFALLFTVLLDNRKSSPRLEKEEEKSEHEKTLDLAKTILRGIGIQGFQKYIEQHKQTIALVLKKYDQEKKLKRKYRDKIVKDIVQHIKQEETKKKEKDGIESRNSEYSDFFNKSLIYYLLYLKKDSLTDFLELDKKNIKIIQE